MRAAPVFRRYGYRGTTLKALAEACGLSIPALYRYFPSKRAFALFPLVALHPELHPPAPDLSRGDPTRHFAAWIDGAVTEAPNYLLAARMLHEVGLPDRERAAMDARLGEHLSELAALARRAAPYLSDARARDLAVTLVNAAMAPALTGIEPDAAALRRELQAILRGYGVLVS